MREHKHAYPYPAIGQARARLIRGCVHRGQARRVHRPGRIEGKASKASKVTANCSLHSARSLGDRVMGLLDRPAAKKGLGRKGQRRRYGQGWPYRTGAEGAVAFAVGLGRPFWCPTTPPTLEAILAATGFPFQGSAVRALQHQNFREEKSA